MQFKGDIIESSSRKGGAFVLNQKPEVNIKQESIIYKAVSLMSKLPEREQEKFCSRLEGYLDGVNYASGKREIAVRQPVGPAGVR